MLFTRTLTYLEPELFSEVYFVVIHFEKLRDFSPQALVGEVSANFVDRRCRVVSTAEPHDC
jgi:hypothetical protein